MTTLIDRRPIDPPIDPLPIDTVDATSWYAAPIRTTRVELDEALVHEAAMRGRGLPIDVDDALARFASQSNRAGALLIRNIPIGPLPPTPGAPGEPTGKDLATELDAAHRGAPPGGAGRVRARTRRAHRAEHRPDAARRRPSDLHVVAVESHVPHRDRVPPAPPALSAAPVPARRPGGADHDGQRPRPVRRTADRDHRGAVRTAVPHRRRCELPRRPGQRVRPDHASGDGHHRVADVRVRRRPHDRHRRRGATRGRHGARRHRAHASVPSCSSPATCS